MSQFRTGGTDWAKMLVIKEAYGFAMTEFTARSWRKALGVSTDFVFDDPSYQELPINDKALNIPNERKSLYSDAHILFVREYRAKYGVELVFDPQLATKKYQY